MKFVRSFMEKNFNTPHSNYKQVIGIIIPLLVDMAFVMAFNMLNTAMVSSSGQASVSAVGMVDSVTTFLWQVFLTLATGGSVVVAQFKGAGSKDMVNRSAEQAVTMVTLVAAVVAGTIAIFNQQVLTLLFPAAEEAVMVRARTYLLGCCAAAPLIGILNSTNGVLRGIGKTRVSLILSMIMNGSQLLMNVLFISILKMDVEGLVIAVVGSRVLGAGAALIYLFKIEKDVQIKVRGLFRFCWDIQKKLLFIGVPFALENLFFYGGRMIVQTFVVSMGTASIATNTICMSLMNVMQCGGSAMALASVTLVGQCIGNGDVQSARKYIYSLMKLASILFVVVLAVAVLGFNPIVGLFNPDPANIPSIFRIVLLFGLAQPLFYPPSFIIPYGLRAAGDARFSSGVALATMWTVRVGAAYLLGVALQMGLMGIWVAMVVEWVLRSAIFLARLRGDKWYRNKLVD